MPSPSTTDLPRPKSWDEFEDIVTDVLKKRWATPHVTRNGRSGQAQDGVDVYARVPRLSGAYGGAQCKRVAELDAKDVDAIVRLAESFVPPLAEFLITTTVARDVHLQQHVRLANVARTAAGKFPVEILFWDDLSLELSGDKRLLAKHFPDWSKLDAAAEQPHFSVSWLIQDQLIDSATVDAQNPYVDMEFILDPYLPCELDYLREHDAEDLAEAMAFNEEVERRLRNPGYCEKWRRYYAREAFDGGARIDLAVVVDNAPSSDILVTLQFDERISVFAAGSKPSYPTERLDLPRHPRLKTEQRRATVADLPGGLMTPLPMPREFDLAFFSQPNTHYLSANDDVVTLRIKRSSPRRKWRFDRETGLGLVISAPADLYRITWTVDAENLDGEQRGELELNVSARHVPLQRRRNSFIGLPMESLIPDVET